MLILLIAQTDKAARRCQSSATTVRAGVCSSAGWAAWQLRQAWKADGYHQPRGEGLGRGRQLMHTPARPLPLCRPLACRGWRCDASPVAPRCSCFPGRPMSSHGGTSAHRAGSTRSRPKLPACTATGPSSKPRARCRRGYPTAAPSATCAPTAPLSCVWCAPESW